ncbi:MAG TPA: glycosyltransferase family 39 protein [Gallionella sp.]|nr:glycosyltransferase family 39 protein [Gallionella sp.]
MGRTITAMSGPLSNKQLWGIVLAVAVIWFSNLEYRKLIKPDEGRYAEIPREMVASGDWVTPRLNGLKYFEKPPLQYWTTAVAYEVFGEHQWTSRLWTALTGFAGILLVWFAGLRLFGREAANYAAILLGSSTLYVLMAHINTLDMGVTFFITLGIAGLLLGQAETDRKKQRAWMITAWAGLAFAVLSKGLMGLVLPGAALFIYMIVQRDFSVLKRMHWAPGLAVFLLITVPWFYLVMKANPEFFQKFFIYEHYTRFTTKELGRYQPWYYFVPILLLGMLPWTVLMFDTLLRAWRASRSPDKMFNAGRFLLVWSVFIYLFFTVSGSKLPSYLLPMFPALALLMGRQLVDTGARRLFWLTAPVLPLTLLGVGFAPFTARLADTPLQLQGYSAYAWWLFAAALTWSLGVIAALILLRRPNAAPLDVRDRDRKFAAVLVLAFSTLLAAQLGASGYNTIARERSAYYIAEAIRPYDKVGEPFYSVDMYEQTLPFYLKRTFTLVQFQDEMAFGIMQEPQRYIPDYASFAKVWQAQPEALAIMPVDTYKRLGQLDFPMKIIYEDPQYIVVSRY